MPFTSFTVVVALVRRSFAFAMVVCRLPIVVFRFRRRLKSPGVISTNTAANARNSKRLPTADSFACLTCFLSAEAMSSSASLTSCSCFTISSWPPPCGTCRATSSLTASGSRSLRIRSTSPDRSSRSGFFTPDAASRTTSSTVRTSSFSSFPISSPPWIGLALVPAFRAVPGYRALHRVVDALAVQIRQQHVALILIVQNIHTHMPGCAVGICGKETG